MNQTAIPTNPRLSRQVRGWIRFIIASAVVFGLGFVLFNYVPFFSRMQHFVIVTGSMEPVIMTGDVVVVDRSVATDELAVGDVIAFTVPVNGTTAVVVHYIADIAVGEDGTRTFRTKPEVSDEWDEWNLAESDVVGIHLFTVPKLGTALLFLQSTVGRIVIIVDLVILFFLVDAFSGKKRRAKA